jgi:hypothetical protein
MTLSRHLLGLRDGILRALRTEFPLESVPTVMHHDGPITREFITSRGFIAPAIVIAILGGCYVPTGGTLQHEVKFALAVITKGDDQERREAEVAILTEHVARVLLARWMTTKIECASTPKELDWQNMFDEDYDRLGMTVWAFNWKTKLSVPPLVDFTDLDVYRQQWVEIFPPGEEPTEFETGEALAEDMIELEVAPEDELPEEEEP